MSQIQCPNCGQSTISKTVKGTVTNAVAQLGGGFAEGVTKAIADSFVDGAGSLVPKFGNKLASLVSLEHICKGCDCIFTAKFFTNGELRETVVKKLPMPEEIISKVREDYIQTLKDKRPILSTVIFALLTLYFLINVFIGTANENGIQIVLSIIFGIPCFIPTLLKANKISSLNEQIEACENQSLRDFKHSHRDLFSQYSQYN